MSDLNNEVNTSRIHRDTRRFGSKLAQWLEKRDNITMLLFISCVMIAFLPRLPMFFPILLEPLFIATLIIGLISYSLRKKKGLPLCFPKSSGVIDPFEKDPATGKSINAEGIVYLGTDMDTGEEIWESDTMLRTHMMFLGTTGSGKALSDRSLVLTVHGWRRMGDIIVGDVLVLPEGRKTTVKGVFPQGRKQMFNMTLASSGGNLTSECCDEHLWLIRAEEEERVASTDEIIHLINNKVKVEIPTGKVYKVTAEAEASATSWTEIISIKPGSIEHCTCILVDNTDHLFITRDINGPNDIGIVTHNTEFLLSVVFNALIHGSGFIYVDGKADSSLYGKIYSMARKMGREDSVRVINFQTGAKDIFGPQSTKMSNTMNIFSVGSSGMLTNLVVSLMSSGKGDVWENRAISFVEALMKPLVFLRDNHGVALDVELIRDFFDIKRIEDLAWRDEDNYAGLGDTLGGMRSYLTNLPGYQRNKHGAQGEGTLEQHGFITMQLIRTFNSLADTYGYIMKTPLAEVDFVDVFLNRRILVVLLPALEKSPSELQNLGKIIVASIKATMAIGLGSQLEGPWAKVLDSKPTTSTSPFMCVLDEYGFYSVEGFSVVPAQARSLGFSAIFAGQDLPAFKKSSEKEAESTLANTNTKFCGKLICTQTAKFFTEYSGQGYFARVGGYERSDDFDGGFKDTQSASIEKIDRISLNNLMAQKIGTWTLWYGPKILKVRSFFASAAKTQILRVTRMLKIAKPNKTSIETYREVNKLFLKTIDTERGLSSNIEAVLVHEFMVISELFAKPSEYKGLELALSVLNDFSRGAAERSAKFENILSSIGQQQREQNGIEDDDDDDYEDSSEETKNDSSSRSFGEDNTSAISAVDILSNYDLGDTKETESSQPEDDDDDMDSPLGWMINSNKFNNTETQIPVSDVDLEPIARATVYGVENIPGELIDSNNKRSYSQNQGQLNRDETELGLAKIELACGANDSESTFSATVVSGKIAEITKYPIVPPTNQATPDDFFKVIQKINESLNGNTELGDKN